MASLPDISPDEMKIFLQEAESLLELLDEQIVRLEQEADDPLILQEIFRVAHTLKGSSGMLGFEKMTSLTHAMEELLDGVRKGLLQVTPELVDALLASLDGLKELKDALAEGVPPTLEGSTSSRSPPSAWSRSPARSPRTSWSTRCCTPRACRSQRRCGSAAAPPRAPHGRAHRSRDGGRDGWW